MISRILIHVYMWTCVSKFKAYKHFNGIYITLGFKAYSDEGLRFMRGETTIILKIIQTIFFDTMVLMSSILTFMSVYNLGHAL